MTDPDRTAAHLAERILSAYARQARGPTHPQQEQSLLARLAEALQPAVREGEPASVSASNATLDAWERAQPDIAGPRIQNLDLADGTVTLAART